MTRFQIFLPEPMLKKLEALSKKGGISVAEIIRRAVDVYLKAESK